jgi:hypothetical protein
MPVECRIVEWWTAQQVVEAFPWDEVPQYLLRDRDRIYVASFRQRVLPSQPEVPADGLSSAFTKSGHEPI